MKYSTGFEYWHSFLFSTPKTIHLDPPCFYFDLVVFNYQHSIQSATTDSGPCLKVICNTCDCSIKSELLLSNKNVFAFVLCDRCVGLYVMDCCNASEVRPKANIRPRLDNKGVVYYILQFYSSLTINQRMTWCPLTMHNFTCVYIQLATHIYVKSRYINR